MWRLKSRRESVRSKAKEPRSGSILIQQNSTDLTSSSTSSSTTATSSPRHEHEWEETVEQVNPEEPSSSTLVTEIPQNETIITSETIKDGEDDENDEAEEEEERSDWEDHGSQADDQDDYAEEEDDLSEYEYEDEDDDGFSGFPGSAPTASASSFGRTAMTTTTATTTTTAQQWREPTAEAVSMSIRAQSESTGSKRRLAQDLFKIMNQDTEEAGFSLAPKSEDSMDLWTIKLFQFDEDSDLATDMKVLNVHHIELEMKFPDAYPFEPPFVQVVQPRFKRQTGFVMDGALCMELLTKDGWNPINDIESVIVSIRSLLVVGGGRLQAAAELSKAKYDALAAKKDTPTVNNNLSKPVATKVEIGSYTSSEAHSAHAYLSDLHKKEGWDRSGWWKGKG